VHRAPEDSAAGDDEAAAGKATRGESVMATALAMMKARTLVEAHIAAYGMVPHPDSLKEAIAKLIDSEIKRASFAKAVSDDTEDLEANYVDEKGEDGQ